ncbi:lipopolysaccharide biosynthesis protein [Halobacteria archaeon AArc-m2/3/4]|uniref:Lipopolysaccharide biosynthesis protein n=1 Tax=Natronoglomus mannanivorans TaxID=2979990 RepID=A0ABT2QH58_9EURY|nr:lipopolysaccharide biosynthesis protein [Halobacteria archaeon AArc-m2/3/4]
MTADSETIDTDDGVLDEESADDATSTDGSVSVDAVSDDERDALLSIAHGAVVTSGGISFERGLSVWIELVLTRGLGPELYGVYAFGWQLVTMLLRFANMGANMTLQRDIPAFADDPDRQRRVLGLSYATTALTVTVMAVSLWLSADWIDDATISHPTFPRALRLFAVLLILIAFIQLHATALKAALSANGEVLLNRILRPGIRLLSAVVAIALGYSVVGVVGVLVVAFGVLAIAAYPATVRVTGIRPSLRGFRSEARHFYDHAIPSALSGIGALLRTRVDVLLIGIFLSATAAGIYNVVLVLVGIAAIPLFAFNQLMPPVASDLYSSGRIGTLNDVYRTVTRLIVTTTIPLVAVLAVFGQDLLAVFGPTFSRGYEVLLVFLVGRFVGNAVGATGILLSMTNNHYPKMVLEWLLAVTNLVLTYLFVLEFGLIGAALGTSVAIAVQNCLQLLLLRRFEGLWPFHLSFLKPIGAGLGMIGVMWLARMALEGALAVGVGTLAGLAVFLALLVAFGVNPRDRLVVDGLVDQYRYVIGAKLAELR